MSEIKELTEEIDDVIDQTIQEKLVASGIPLICGEVCLTGGVFIDVSAEFLRSILDTNISLEGSLLVVDEPLVTEKDIELSKHIDGNYDFLVGMPKYVNIYLRQSTTSTWFRCETPVAQVVIDCLHTAFEEEYDEDYEDFDPEYDSNYEDLSDEKIQEFAISISNDSAFGSLTNRAQRIDFVSGVVGKTTEKEVESWDIQKICSLAHDYRELAVMPNHCKSLKNEGKTSKEIGELLGITPYKAGKYLLIETPDHIKEAFSL